MLCLFVREFFFFLIHVLEPVSIKFPGSVVLLQYVAIKNVATDKWAD